ncbi:MAG: GIY-YIG nuclease family protein [Alloalcanivorax venustensis]|uniref:GIY-YIG nuclease family protein n=1 Tax=Alloalcanivorax venustensis TaxID=172371 RepID=UPI00329A6196
MKQSTAPAAGDWWVYMLRCADGSLYTGVTTDVLRRWQEHNGGPRGARYTRARRPVALVMWVAVPGRAAAGRLEVRLKALSRTRKEKLIQAVTGVSVANPPGNCLTASTSELENPE